MVEAVIFLAALVAWFSGAIFALARFIECGAKTTSGWLVAAALFLSAAWVLAQTVEHGRKFPCVAYESRMTYNAATKTMMPMRVCVERGEWEETP